MAEITVHRPRSYRGDYDHRGRNPGWFVSLSRTSINLENPDHCKLFSRNAIYDSKLDRVIESYDNFRRVVEPALNASGFNFEGHDENVVPYESLNALLPDPSHRRKVSSRLKGIDTDLRLPKAKVIKAAEELVAISPGQHIDKVIGLLPETAGGYYNAQSEPVAIMTVPEFLAVRDDLELAGLKFSEAFQTQSKKYLGMSKQEVFDKCGACSILDLVVTPNTVRETTLLVDRKTGVPYRARVHAVTQKDTKQNHRRNAKKPVQWTMSVLSEQGWVKFTHITAQREFRPATVEEKEAFSEISLDVAREKAASSLFELAHADVPENQITHYMSVNDGTSAEGGVYAVPRSLFDQVNSGSGLDISGGALTRIGFDTVYIQSQQYHETFVPGAKRTNVDLKVRSTMSPMPDKYRHSMTLNNYFLQEGTLLPGSRISYRGRSASFMGPISMSEKVVKLENPLGTGAKYIGLEELKKMYPDLQDGNAVVLDGARYSWEVNDLNSLGKMKLRFDDGTSHIAPAEEVMANLDRPVSNIKESNNQTAPTLSR